MKIKRKPAYNLLGLALGLMAAALISCNLTNLLGKSENEVDPVALAEALAAEVVDDRPGVMLELGRPDAFDISIVHVEGGDVRMESWRYFQYATRVDFVDGEAVWTVAIDPVPEGTIFAAWYDPLAFTSGMSLEEVTTLASAQSPAGMVPVYIDVSQGGEDLAGGMILVGDQILIGIEENKVVYVETVPLIPEGGE